MSIGAASILPLAVPAPLALAPLLLALTAVAVIGAGLDHRAALEALLPLRGTAMLFGLVLVWSLIGISWSIAPERSLIMALRLAGTTLCGFVLLGAALALDERQRRSLERWLCIGTLLGTVLLGVEIASGLSLLKAVRGLLGDRAPIDVLLNRAATVLVLLQWPVAAILLRRRRRGPWLAGLWTAAALVLLAHLASASALLAALAGLATGALAYFWPRFVGWAAAAGGAVAILASPLAGIPLGVIERLAPHLKPSGVHRLVIWNFVGDQIAKHPFAGWGLDTARVIPGGEATIAVMTREGMMQAQLLPLHPHNAALQWWLELGLPGAVLGAGLVLLIVRAILNAGWGRAETAAGLALFASGLLISMLSYGIWQFWWLAALWFAAAFAASVLAARAR
ncbi:MAG: O-antigen ligase family protein [Proteobacteria bacterium]|nr:O-antigen ligase family protein [Pseudomonadota bacterium]MBI3497485.1 O-antigen ligase family protein [Pseudomonadota bacterium]